MDQKLPKRLAGGSLFKEPLLVHFFLISILIATALPLYHALFIHPLFSQLLIKDKEEDAISIAKHLSSDIELKAGELEEASLPVAAFQKAVKQGNEFGLVKLKVYSKTGAVLFSTDSREVGEIHKGVHFQEVLAKGKVQTKVVQEGMKSLEGKTVHLDVVETYVPFVKDGHFLGAFEIYYDISERKDQLHNLLLRSFGLLVGLAACFMAITIVVLYKANKNIVERRRAEKALHDAHDTLERKVQERTQELLRVNEQLQAEIEDRKRAERKMTESKAKL